MIFLRYESFREYVRMYPVTVVMLAINIAMAIVVAILPNRYEVPLFQFGAITNAGDGPEWYMFITSMFLHSGFRHVLFNSFAIFVFAPPLERMLGHFRYLLLYLLSGVIGNIVSEVLHTYVAHDVYASVGASGAVYGIFGAYLYLILFRKEILDYQSRQTVTIILVVGAIFSLLVSQINWYAHFGGLLGGLLLIGLFIKFGYNR